MHAHLGEILFEHSGAFFQINMHRDCTSRLQSNTELNMLKLIDFSEFKGTKLCAELWPNSCKNTYVISFSHYNSCTEFFFKTKYKENKRFISPSHGVFLMQTSDFHICIPLKDLICREKRKDGKHFILEINTGCHIPYTMTIQPRTFY